MKIDELFVRMWDSVKMIISNINSYLFEVALVCAKEKITFVYEIINS